MLRIVSQYSGKLFVCALAASVAACSGGDDRDGAIDSGNDVDVSVDGGADTDTSETDADDASDTSDTGDVGDALDVSDVSDTNDASDVSDAGDTPDAEEDTTPDTGLDTADDVPSDVPDTPIAQCPALADPTGTIVRVTPDQADQLSSIVADAAEGTTILLEDGIYTMTGSEGQRRLNFRTPNVTLRSASGNAENVVIDGEYTTLEMIAVLASNVTIAEITLTHAVDHPIHVTAESQAVDGTLIYGVRLIDHGEQFIKINPNGERTFWPDSGRIACSYFELTDAGRPNIERNPGGCYTGGVDAHGIRDWVIENNEIRDIYCAGEGLAEHGIHIWQGGRDNIIQNNLILDCARGIGLGLRDDGPRRIYDDDPGVGHLGHWGGIVRNNIVFGSHNFHDTGIELAQVLDALVIHNTVVNSNETGFFSSIDVRFANTQVELRNNLTRRITYRGEGQAELGVNLEGTPLNFFVDPSNGDFHLVGTATDAIDAGVAHPESGVDIDGESRTDGSPDLGADELGE